MALPFSMAKHLIEQSAFNEAERVDVLHDG
jgi:hypothetical protein